MAKRMSPKKEMEAFNAKVNIGDEVYYWSHPSAEPVRFKTDSHAHVLSGHTAVVFLAGKAGCVACRAVRPVSDFAPTHGYPAEAQKVETDSCPMAICRGTGECHFPENCGQDASV